MHQKSLHIRLLGSPEVFWNGTQLQLVRRQIRALFYRLAVDMQPVTRDELLLLLWPNSDEGTARRNLTRLLSALRQDLPDPKILQTTKTTISLNPSLTWCDTVAFIKLIDSKDIGDWEQAISFYRDAFLSGFSVPNSSEFDMWQSRQMHIYERRLLATIMRLTAAKRETGKYEEAIALAQWYMSIDDLSEEVHHQLIELYALTGNRSAALKQFEQCVLVLERELGVPPLPETRAAYEAIRDNRHLASRNKTPKVVWATLPSLDLPIIGRDGVWEKLKTAHGRYQKGGVIFISGEPGVGKSRLMQEFATRCQGLVLSGINEEGEQSIPYQPLIQALRQALIIPSRWTHTLPIWLAELSRLMPELTAHFSDLPTPIEVEPQQAQARLFESFWQVFTGLAVDSPLLLCLDNVHWADESTRAWLQYITKQLFGSSICILATYRTYEQPVLAGWRGSLKRAGLVGEISLGGLTETAVAHILKQINDGLQVAKDWHALIHEATGGNTYFVLETIRELLETEQLANPPVDVPLPTTVLDAVLQRTSRLSPLAQQILEVTALLSTSAQFPMIHEVSGRDELGTAASLDELVAHQLLLADEKLFRFHHDLAREAIYHNMSPWRRRLLHKRSAIALLNASNNQETEYTTIATHFEMAGESGQAIHFYWQAAKDAQLLFAHQEAIENLQRVLNILTEEREAEGIEASSSEKELAQLYEDLGDNLNIIGKFPAAEEAYRKAFECWSERDPIELVELDRKVAGTLPPQQRLEEAEELHWTALARLDETTPTTATSKWQLAQLNILLSLFTVLYLQRRPEAMEALKDRTQSLLANVGTIEQSANFYDQMGQMYFLKNRCRNFENNLKYSRKALSYAIESGKPQLIARQQFHRGFQLLWANHYHEAEELLKTSLSAAETTGYFLLIEQNLTYLNILYRIQGRVEKTAEQLPRLIKISNKIGYHVYIGVAQAQTAWLHFRAGEWEQAQLKAKEAVETWAGPIYPFQWLANWILLAISLRQNQLPEAIYASLALLDLEQQKLHDEIEDVLKTAVDAWDKHDETNALDGLETAVTLAEQYGYL